MPSDMRLQCPSEDTPPSTRPPSVASSGASTSGTPHRSTSMDSLHTNSSTSEKPSGEEYIPTRLIRPTPKVNTNAMQFVKTGPAMLHKSAKEQMKKVEIVKSLRKTSLQEEEDWQSNSSSTNLTSFDEGSDWQSNLDKWKSSRRKRNEDVLERVIEVKKNELDEEFSKSRRKSKTFSEMREEKSKRGRRYNLVVHDDDNNDLGDLGLSTAKNGQSLSDGHEEGEAKSDAGFCTGSDTGSDGVFAEDNISDTSSALGDKREIHDSLLDSGSPPTSKKDSTIINGHENGHRVSENTSTSVKSTSTTSTTVINSEYTYDKAIEEYKQFAENSAKKRTSSVTSLSSNASGSKEEHDKSLSSKRVEEKFSFYDGDVKEPRIIRREKKPAKIDIDKRRSMFELRNIDQQEPRKTLDYRKSLDVSSSLKSKVASFESINDSDNRTKSVKPLRDTKFKEKLASFNKKNSSESNLLTQRKTPERDQNFYQKLHSFTQMESKTVSESPSSRNSSRKSSPDRKQLWKSSDKLSSSFSSERAYEKGASPTTTTPLKDRIASYENLTPDHSRSKRELSVSMENLNATKPQPLLGSRTLQTSQSVSDLSRRTPFTTHYMVVEVDEEAEEKSCVKRNISRVSQTGEEERSSERSKNVSKRLTIYEEIEKVVIQRDVSKAPIYSIFNEVKDFEVKTPLLEKKLDSAADERRPPPLPEKTKSKLSSSEEHSSGLSDTVSRTSRTLPETPKESSHFRSPKLPADGSKSPRKLPQIPVDSQRPEELLTSKNVNESSSFLVPDVVPINEDKPLLNWPLQTSSETPLEPPPHTVPEVAPPPVPPPRVPSMEDPYTSSTSFITDEESKGIPYCDEDIDEVIDSESLPPVRKNEESANDNFKDTSLDRNIKNFNSEVPQVENRNKYSKKPEDTERYEVKELLPPTPPLPQSLSGEETSAAVQKSNYSPSPPVPHKNRNLAVFEVIDVTWTENSSSPAAPPSVPPPPPPPEEEGEEDGTPDEANAVNGEGDPTLSNSSPAPMGMKTKPLVSSPQSTKQEIRKMRSDFLGTNPHVEEELTIQPPPDLNELLRQEREAERKIIQKQASLKREPLFYDSDSSYSSAGLSSGRPKYTWEDRVKADEPKSEVDSLNDSVDTMEFHTPLTNSSKSLHALKTFKEYASQFSAMKKALSEGNRGSSKTNIIHSRNNKVVDSENLYKETLADTSESVGFEKNKMNILSTNLFPQEGKNVSLSSKIADRENCKSDIQDLKTINTSSHLSEGQTESSEAINQISPAGTVGSKDSSKVTSTSKPKKDIQKYKRKVMLTKSKNVDYGELHPNFQTVYEDNTNSISVGENSKAAAYNLNKKDSKKPPTDKVLLDKIHRSRNLDRSSGSEDLKLAEKGNKESKRKAILTKSKNIDYGELRPNFETNIKSTSVGKNSKEYTSNLYKRNSLSTHSKKSQTDKVLGTDNRSNSLDKDLKLTEQDKKECKKKAILTKSKSTNYGEMRYTSQTDFKTNFDSIPVKEKSKEKGNDIGNGNKNSTSVDSKNTSSDKVLLDRLHRSRSVDGNSGRKDSQAKDQDYFQDDFRFLGKALNKQLFDYKRNENKFSENFEDVPKTKNILDSHMKSKMISAKSEEDLRVKNGEFSKGKNISEELTKINLDKNKSNSFSSLPINDKIEFFEINKTNSKSLAELSSPKDSYKSFSKSLTELSSAEGSYKSVYSSPFPSYLRNTNKNSMSTDISGLHNLNTPDYLNELPEKYNTHRVSTTREEDEPLTTLFARNLDKVKKLLSTSESDLLLATKELPNSIENFDKTERMDSGKRESTNSENDFRNTSHEDKEFCKSFDQFIYSDLSSSKEKSTLAPSSNEMKSYSDATAIHRSGCQSSLEYSSNSSKLGDTSLLHAYNGDGSSQVHTSLTLKDDVARKKHKKLAELEQEMEKHDRVMLQRVQGSSSQDKLSTFDHETSSDIPSTHLQYNGSIAPTVEAPPLPEPNNNTVPQTQNLQHVSNSENIQHRRQQEVYSTPFYKHESNEYKSVDSSSYYSRQKNTQETTYSELPSVSREIKKVVGRDPLSKSLSDGAPPPPVPRKQSILALSAIPKPKLTENESWIMKRKTETTKKDYSKHWLIQEAEQRRLEQQERITRPNQIPLNKQTNLQTTPGYQTHFQNIKSSFNSASYNQNQNIYSNTSVQNNVNTSAGFNGPNSSPTRPSSDLPPNRFISNNEPVTNATTVSPTIAPNNNWMKQTKTYQPQQATSPSSSNSKPLPDAIISSITQRVNNKFNNGNNRTPIYNSATCNAKDEEDYHDYMNTGSLNVGSSYNNNNKTNNSTSPVGSPTGTPGQHFSSHVPPAGQQGQVGEDQRLLSVSGKKKCSHCGEELGRGAAMIIESLRLFYHIPCFKCCVCGIQLGNGTSGADVRVRNHKLHCHNCYSNDEGMKFSKV